MLQSTKLLQFEGLKHYFLNKKESSFEGSYKNIIGSSVTIKQIHGTKIIYLSCRPQKHYQADGMITQKKIYLNIRTADCLPIFFYESSQKIVAAVHAGWRGLKAGIIENAMNEINRIGGKTKNIFVAIGPHIGSCCFLFNGKKLNLGHLAQKNLVKTGIPRQNIDLISSCTCCDTQFSSHRREGAIFTRMSNLIGLV